MNVDISRTIQANSAQVNADDVLQPITVTITAVEAGNAEQPIFIHLAEMPDKTFRPAKTVRRLLVHAWGTDGAEYVGRRLTLYNDKTVKWAGQEVGGVRVSHMSHIGKPLTVNLSVSRGKRAPFTVQPLPDTDPHIDTLTTAGTLDALKAAWENLPATVRARPDVVAAKNTRKTELESDPSTKEDDHGR